MALLLARSITDCDPLRWQPIAKWAKK